MAEEPEYLPLDPDQRDTGERYAEATGPAIEREFGPVSRSYWELGRFIYRQNPYMPSEQLKIPRLVRGSSKVRIVGPLESKESDNHWKPEPGKPKIPRGWFYRSGKKPRDIPAEGNRSGSPEAKEERNVVKEIEIEYEPVIQEERPEGERRRPHIIILYGGGDH